MLDCLHKEKGSKIWEEWAKLKLENKTKAETVISYLPSLEKFLNFVLEEQNEEDSNLPLPDEVTVKGLGKVSRKLGAWHSTIRKEYMSENWETVLNETCNQVKPSDIKDFNQTEPALQAKKLLEEAITRELDISEYCIVRDYLLTSLLLQNGQRPGVLEEVLRDDFNDAEADPVTGIYNIFATQHKTSAAGPAQHTMTKSLHRHMQIFASHVRTIFHTNAEHLFVTSTGVPFQPGTLGKRITNFWTKTSTRPDIRITATRLRKMAATTVNLPDKEKRAIHAHMTHTEHTADKCYIRPDPPSISASSHAMLKKNIGYIEESNSEVDADKEKSAVETSNKVEADLKSDKSVLEHQYNALLETLFEEEIRSN